MEIKLKVVHQLVMGVSKSMDKLVAGFLCPFVLSFHWKDEIYDFIICLVDLNYF